MQTQIEIPLKQIIYHQLIHIIILKHQKPNYIKLPRVLNLYRFIRIRQSRIKHINLIIIVKHKLLLNKLFG